jgi:putative SOS response-associated peptidase YedK
MPAREADSMCATYSLILEEDEDEIIGKLREKYSETVAEKFRHVDLYPKSEAPVVGTGNKVALLRWGFPMKDSGRVVFNARAEGLFEKPFYMDCLNNRCAVPFTSFYEWGVKDGEKRKFAIRPEAGGVSYMAALYRPFIGGNGARGFCFVIITTQPCSQIEAIHSRMPAIIGRGGLDGWLDRQTGTDTLLVPYKGDLVISLAG